MTKPSIFGSLGQGLKNLKDDAVKGLKWMDGKASELFDKAKERFQEEEETPAFDDPTEDLLQSITRNHAVLDDALKLSAVPREKVLDLRSRAISLIETLGLLKNIIGEEEARKLIDRTPVSYDDIQATAEEVLTWIKP